MANSYSEEIRLITKQYTVNTGCTTATQARPAMYIKEHLFCVLLLGMCTDQRPFVAWVTRCLSYHTSMQTETWWANGQRCQGDVRNCPSLNIPLFCSTVLSRALLHDINSYLFRNSKDICYISRANKLRGPLTSVTRFAVGSTVTIQFCVTKRTVLTTTYCIICIQYYVILEHTLLAVQLLWSVWKKLAA